MIRVLDQVFPVVLLKKLDVHCVVLSMVMRVCSLCLALESSRTKDLADLEENRCIWNTQKAIIGVSEW